MEWDWVMQAERSDDRWRQARRVLDRGLRPGAAALYRPVIQARTRILLSRLLETPHQWEDHIDLSVGFVTDSHHVPEVSGKRSAFKGS
jgi:hypothetical protein